MRRWRGVVAMFTILATLLLAVPSVFAVDSQAEAEALAQDYLKGDDVEVSASPCISYAYIYPDWWNNTSSVIGYDGAVDCPWDRGAYGTLTVWLESATVGSSSWSMVPGTTQSVTCGFLDCYTSRYSYTVTSGTTKKYRTAASWSTLAPRSRAWWYNNSNKPYPFYTWPKSPYYVPFNDNWIFSSKTPRDNGFRDRCIAYYKNNNLAIPSGDYDAHHILPLQYGGSNDETTNCALVSRSFHQTYFNSWWSNFDPPGPIGPQPQDPDD